MAGSLILATPFFLYLPGVTATDLHYVQVFFFLSPFLAALSWDGWVAARGWAYDKSGAAMVSVILGTLVWIWGTVGFWLRWCGIKDPLLEPFSAGVANIAGLTLAGGGLLYMIGKPELERFHVWRSVLDRELELDEET